MANTEDLVALHSFRLSCTALYRALQHGKAEHRWHGMGGRLSVEMRGRSAYVSIGGGRLRVREEGWAVGIR
jgi:hypothetical protein